MVFLNIAHYCLLYVKRGISAVPEAYEISMTLIARRIMFHLALRHGWFIVKAASFVRA